MEGFKDLRVWEKAYTLTPSVYKKTRGFPKAEMYGSPVSFDVGSAHASVFSAASVGACFSEKLVARSQQRFSKLVANTAFMLASQPATTN
jgi:hypothetical protein